MNFAWMHHLKELDFEVLRPYEPGKCFELVRELQACHYGLVCNDKEHYAVRPTTFPGTVVGALT